MIYKIGYRTNDGWKYKYFPEPGIGDILEFLAVSEKVDRFSVAKMAKIELEGVKEDGKEE